MPQLFGDTIALVEAAMRFRVARQGLLASNVANADTPGYRRVDVRFETALARADARMARTDARHLGAGDTGQAGWRIERGAKGTRPDGNGVNLERETVRLSRNAGAFTKQAAVLSRLVALTRTAVDGQAR